MSIGTRTDPRARPHGSSTDPAALSLWNDAELNFLKVSADDVEDVRKLGSGAFADVWLVKFRHAELLASKRLRASEATRTRTQAFVEEIKLVSTLTHPNVVALKGVTWVRESDLQALFEYMDRGDVRDYLADPQLPKHWTLEKLQIAVDVAEALVYVHSFLPPLVHRDLKSRNILLTSGMSGASGGGMSGASGGGTSGMSGAERASNVDGDGNSVLRAKLTDFGVSRYRSEQNTMTGGVGTGRWLAPEVIAGRSDYGPAADIYSFGVVLFELDSHQIPYADARGPNGHVLAEVALLQFVAAGELTPRLSASCPSKIAELASRCFDVSPVNRPTALELVYELRKVMNDPWGLYN